jgi:hypothetical protein
MTTETHTKYRGGAECALGVIVLITVCWLMTDVASFKERAGEITPGYFIAQSAV